MIAGDGGMAAVVSVAGVTVWCISNKTAQPNDVREITNVPTAS